MTDHDRGAYTPQTDAPLSFDARRPSGGGRPVPMTLMISGMVLVVLLVGVVFFYRSGVRRENEAPQVIGAPVPATKSAPPASEQPSDAAAGLQVYKSETAPLSKPEAAASGAPKFTPAPEQPAPRPAPLAAPPPPAPAQAAPVPHPALAQAAPAPAEAPPPSAPVAAAMKPAAKPAARTPTAPTPTPAASAVPAGSAMVQIGAFSSAALADKGWSDDAKAMGGAMSGKTKTVQVVERDGKTFYRTSVGGFGSRADAVRFCDTLKAAGKICIVK